MNLPERLPRNMARPLCRLHGDCEERGECYGDCDCNDAVQEAWQELRESLIDWDADQSELLLKNIMEAGL